MQRTGFVLLRKVVVSGVLAFEIERDGANEQVVPDQGGDDLLHQGGVCADQFCQLLHRVRVLRVEKQKNRHLDRRRHQNVRLFRVSSRDLALKSTLQARMNSIRIGKKLCQSLIPVYIALCFQ